MRNRQEIQDFLRTLFKEHEGWVCERCGCTTERACWEGCYWVKRNLCSECATAEELQDYIARGGQIE